MNTPFSPPAIAGVQPAAAARHPPSMELVRPENALRRGKHRVCIEQVGRLSGLGCHGRQTSGCSRWCNRFPPRASRVDVTPVKILFLMSPVEPLRNRICWGRILPISFPHPGLLVTCRSRIFSAQLPRGGKSLEHVVPDGDAPRMDAVMVLS